MCKSTFHAAEVSVRVTFDGKNPLNDRSYRQLAIMKSELYSYGILIQKLCYKVFNPSMNMRHERSRHFNLEDFKRTDEASETRNVFQFESLP